MSGSSRSSCLKSVCTTLSEKRHRAMKLGSTVRYLSTAWGALAFLFVPGALYAQCPLCYRAAASASARFIESLRIGILVLLPAPFIFGAVIGFLAYKKRNTFAYTDEDAAGHSAVS
jgi:hypothetical protein